MTTSVNNKFSRYVSGGITETTQTHLEWWNKKKILSDPSDKKYTLEKKYENRPDLLAFALYDDSKLWWIIFQYNKILDPVTEFVEGKELILPTKERVYSEILTGKIGGAESLRLLNK